MVDGIHGRAAFLAHRHPHGRAARGPLRATFVSVPAAGSGAGPAPGPHHGPVAVGYVIPKRCGNAVTRNRLRRRLRAVVAEAASGTNSLVAGSYVIRAEPAAVNLTHGQLQESLTAVLAGAGRGRPARPSAGSPS